MKGFSFNCRGLANPDKKLALKRLCLSYNLDFLMLQETLGDGQLIHNSLKNFVPDWRFFYLDARGRSGGLALGFNSRTVKICNAWGGQGFLGADITSNSPLISLRIINIYRPCHHREAFWDSLLQQDFMQSDDIIIGGDLNFSLGMAEFLGHRAQSDALTNYFEKLLDDHDLLSLNSTCKMPPWRNRQIGEHALARHLDRFLIRPNLLNRLGRIRHWVGMGGYSDHSPIFLDLDDEAKKSGSPFKFNVVWIGEASFQDLVNKS